MLEVKNIYIENAKSYIYTIYDRITLDCLLHNILPLDADFKNWKT